MCIFVLVLYSALVDSKCDYTEPIPRTPEMYCSWVHTVLPVGDEQAL